MEGEDRIRLLDRPEDGEYVITASPCYASEFGVNEQMPNTYARGILFGKMILELGDVSSIRNDELDYHCDVDFRTKVSLQHSTMLTTGMDLWRIQRYPWSSQGSRQLQRWRDLGTLARCYRIHRQEEGQERHV